MNLSIKLKKMKNMTTKQILKKIIRKINKKIYYVHRKIKIQSKGINLEDSFFYNFRTSCRFLYDINEKNHYILELKKLYLFDSIINAADKISNHELNLFGSGNKYLGEKLPWNEDFKTGFKWNNQFYKNIKIVDLSNNADVKVPWEISRFQHIFTLGKAYWLTANEKYALEFKEQIEDWIEKNPVEMSVNWTCTMDVAIRAVNWICGYFFFKESSSIEKKFWIKFNKFLYLHGRFIYKNLENEGEHNGNHYLSDLVGLIWIGIYFGDFIVKDKEVKNNPKDWREFGISEFESEMKKEVNEDGTDYEASTSYHRLVTEIFLITTILCNKNDIYFSKHYMIKLEKMCEFIMNITKPNGLSPLIGDSDDGRLIIPSNYYDWNRREFRHILSIAGEYFDRDDFRGAGKDFKEDALWIKYSFKNVKKEIQLGSKEYKDGGYYILRNDRIYCLIRCGELSCRGDGAHSHNDQLSFELNVDGEDFIIDPGTYVYTANYKMRNLYRTTKMHNTLSISGYEQNDFNEYDLFYMKEQSYGKCKEFHDTFFYGEHYGYKEKCGVIHNRKIKLDKGVITIEDKLIGNKTYDNVYLSFILDYGVEIKEKQNGIELIKNKRKIFIQFDNSYLIESAFVSYGYGQKLDTKKILIEMKNMNSFIKMIYC